MIPSNLENQIDEQINFFFEIMKYDTDVCITDGKGKVLKVNENYGVNYGVDTKDIVGKTVYELEKEGVFYPSVTAVVLKENQKVTILQKNKLGNEILTTGVPIFDENDKIKYVVSFQSIDIANLRSLKEKYKTLQDFMNRHYGEIKRVKFEDVKKKGLIVQSTQMENVVKLILHIADTNVNILITGETGVGKNMIAKLIHNESSRRDKAFIEINCGSIPENLMESELFGYEKGSFTGASANGKIGKIAMAKGGTLFLDEIGELSLDMQKKLLQVIQEKKIIPVGGTKYFDVDFRLITATNKDLIKSIQKGGFREDLYYRINVVPVHITPLREREDDILPLIIQFLQESNEKYDKNHILSKDTINCLCRYSWPGNVREVKNIIERLVLTAINEEILISDLPENISPPEDLDSGIEYGLKKALSEYEKKIVLNVYSKYDTTVEMAKELKINQSTVVKKLQKYVPNYSKKNK